MNEDIKRRWVERLRSGEIQQTRGQLGTPSGERCFQGVLCDIAVEDGVISKFEDANRVYYNGGAWILPTQVLRWAGLRGHSPSVLINGHAVYLADLSDQGMSFRGIADLIEAQSLDWDGTRSPHVKD